MKHKNRLYTKVFPVPPPPHTHRGHTVLPGAALFAVQSALGLEEPSHCAVGALSGHPQPAGRRGPGTFSAHPLLPPVLSITSPALVSVQQDVEVEKQSHFAVVNMKTAAPTAVSDHPQNWAKVLHTQFMFVIDSPRSSSWS